MDLTSYPLVIWVAFVWHLTDSDYGYGAVAFVCCMSDIISHIKGYMAVDIISDWRDPIGWLPMVMVIYGVSMNTDDWDKKNIKTLVWTGWAIPMTQSPGTHKMIRWSKRRELSKDDTCKSRQINPSSCCWVTVYTVLVFHLSFLILLLRYIYLTAVKTFGFMSSFFSLFFCLYW